MQLRDTNLRKLGDETFDVLVIGGGINGAVSAAALTARGVKTALVDRGDFAGGTSQESSNLAWGGIKYLESFEFALVRKLCLARNRLMRAFPSSVKEIRFYTAHEKRFRHGLWKLVAGVWFYWLMGNLFTRRPRWLSTREIAAEEPIIKLDGYDGGFEYSDCYLHDNDARFTFNFIRTALDHGGIVANYVEVVSSTRGADGIWTTHARETLTGRRIEIRSRLIINAAGPWADSVNQASGAVTKHRHVFSKGIHLLVDRLTPNRRVLTFFADDGRLFFVIPMGRRTCIGTTDTRVDSADVQVTDEDRRFVLDNINKRLNLPAPLEEKDVIAERCGVRPLVTSGQGGSNDWFQLSRKHVVEVDAPNGRLSIFGGKLTDCLNVGEEVCDEVRALGVALPHPRQAWYGEPPAEVRRAFEHQARLINLDRMTSPLAHEPLTERLWRRYGRDAFVLLETIRADPSMAETLIEGAEYLRGELALSARREMIVKLDDFLRRRSKIALVVRREDMQRAKGMREACGILFGAEAEAKFAEYFDANPTQGARPAA